MSADGWRAAWLGAAGIVCLVGPLLAAAAWKRRTGESYRTFGHGAAVFAISQLALSRRPRAS